MPTYSVSKAALENSRADLVVIGAIATDKGPRLGKGGRELGKALGLRLKDELDALGFDGSAGSAARIPTRKAIPADTVLVVGLGKQRDLDADVLRRAGAVVASAASRKATVATSLYDVRGVGAAEAAQALVEGMELGSYRFTTYKSNGDAGSLLEKVTLHGDGGADTKRGLREGQAIADAVRLVRDLVNEPPAGKRPPILADRVKKEVRGSGVRVRVLDEKKLAAGGYGGILGVGQGAGDTAPPRLVELTYAPEGASAHVALVGKGITFDSGGLSLKPSNGMVTMKMDMAGAATVLGATLAAAKLKLKVRITGLMALAENMPSGTAIRPSDVLTIKGGKTVEVLNTDAEGRLVLADTLVHASEMEPDAIVDMATLTGAVVAALGDKIGGLMATDDRLADALLKAADRSGERLWRLPLPSDLYGSDLRGDVGDIKNAGWRNAGTIRAGLFLNEFVADGIPWAHLDIAGIAWTDGDNGYLKKGGTGAPLRTIVEWLRSL